MQNSMIKKKLRSFIIFISDFRAGLATIFYDNAYNNATKYIKVFCATLKNKKKLRPRSQNEVFSPYKAVMRQATIFNGLKTEPDCGNSCRVCPAL